MLTQIVTQPRLGFQRRRRSFSSRRWRIPIVLGAAALAVTLLLLPAPSAKTAASWRLVSFNSAPFRDLGSGQGQPGLQCVTDEICYAPGFTPGSGSSNDLIYKTIDGGQQWSPLAPLPAADRVALQSFRCSSATVCFFTDPTGNALTSDGGASWISIGVPVASEEGSAAWCMDALHCIVSEVSADGPLTGFAVTSDGGAQWSAQTVPPGAGGPWDLTCDTSGRCLLVMVGPGTVSTLTSTTWAGPWTAQPRASIGHPAIVYHSCADATHCMLVGLDSTFEIITTKNAGLTWQVVGPPAGWLNMPTAVGCANDSECWIAMSLYDTSSPNGAYRSPLIEATTDFGATWTQLSLPATSPPVADVLTLSCPPSGDGCLAIGNGKDHFVLPRGRPHPLSGPILLSNLP